MISCPSPDLSHSIIGAFIKSVSMMWRACMSVRVCIWTELTTCAPSSWMMTLPSHHTLFKSGKAAGEELLLLITPHWTERKIKTSKMETMTPVFSSTPPPLFKTCAGHSGWRSYVNHCCLAVHCGKREQSRRCSCHMTCLPDVWRTRGQHDEYGNNHAVHNG